MKYPAPGDKIEIQSKPFIVVDWCSSEQAAKALANKNNAAYTKWWAGGFVVIHPWVYSPPRPQNVPPNAPVGDHPAMRAAME